MELFKKKYIGTTVIQLHMKLCVENKKKYYLVCIWDLI